MPRLTCNLPLRLLSFLRKRRIASAFLFCFATCLLISRPPEILAATTVLLGDQTVESTKDSNGAGIAEAYQATANTGGAVSALTLYVDSSNAAKTIVVGLYSNSGGHPATLLSQASMTSFTKGTWNTVSIPSAAVIANTVYWIAILGTKGTIGYRDGGTNCVSWTSAQSTLTTLPASWSLGQSWASCRLSAYGSGSTSGPTLSLSQSAVSFGATQGSTTNPAATSVNVSNTGTGTLSFAAASDSSWLSVTPGSGAAPQPLQIAATLGSLVAGTYTGHVTVTASGAQGSPAKITVTFTVAAPPATLSLSTTTLSFSVTQGSSTNPAAVSVGVSNSGGGNLSFTAASDSTWLQVSPAKGTAPKTLQISAALGSLAANTYTGHITVTASGAQGSPATVTVTFTVVPPSPVLSLSAKTLSFAGTQGSTTNLAPASVNVSNTGGGTLAFTTSSDSSWLSVSPTGGTAPATLQISASTAGLAADTYTGVITVTPNGSTDLAQLVTVTLVVAPPPPVLFLSQTSLTFSAIAAIGANPVPASVMVSNTGGGSFTFSASSNQNWLSVSSTSSTVSSGTPATLTVSVIATGLAVNSYTGSITVTATGALSSPTTIPVTFNVTAPLPPSLLGDTSIESQVLTVPPGQAVAFPETAIASDTMGSLTVYLDAQSTASRLVVGVYADNGSGAPGSLLGQGTSETLVPGGGWNQIMIQPVGDQALAVAAQTPYWVAILGTQGGSPVYRVGAISGACVSMSSGDAGLSSLDGTWNLGSTSSSCPASLFGSAGTAPTVFSLSGMLSPSNTGGSLATVALTGSAMAATVSGSDGSYVFNGLVNGSYTVTPSNTGFLFSPGSQMVTIADANPPNVNFGVSDPPPPTYSISGTISGAGGVNATVALNGGSAPVSTITDSLGNYSFSGLAPGTYVVAPSLAGYLYNPNSQSVTITNLSLSGVNFGASLAPPTYEISGIVTPSLNGSGAGALLTLSGAASATTYADPVSGAYSFSGLVNGSYTVTPSATGAVFNTASQNVTINGANKVKVNFTAAALIFFDDFTGSALSSSWYSMDEFGRRTNGEIQCYVPSQDTTSSGFLVITTAVKNATCDDDDSMSSYSSGEVEGAFTFKYGTVEFRAKMPGGTGTWPAIWMLGYTCQPTQNDSFSPACPWPQAGANEIDITEIKNGNLTQPWQNVVSPSGVWFTCRPTTTDVTQNFHVYDLVWTSTSLTWKIDGVTTCTQTQSQYIPATPMFLIINTAVGGTGGGTVVPSTLPQTMLVDYVSVTQP